MAVFAVHDEAAQLRTKAQGFTLPVAQQADRRNDQGRRAEAPGVLFELDMGQRLKGFAQPHVVGQDAVQAMGAQKLQPVEPLLLVGAQAGLDAWRYCRPRQLQLADQLLRQIAQGLRPRPHRPFTQTDGGAQRVQARQFEAVARQIPPPLAH